MHLLLLTALIIASTVLWSEEPRLTAVVRPTPHLLVSTGAGDCEATELWLVNPDTHNQQLLVRGHDAPDIKNLIAGISAPVFSPDRQTVYFVSAAWAVTGSIQKVAVATKHVSFIIDGSSVEVIPSGPHQGQLLVERALVKFDRAGESLGRDVYLWLVSPDGVTLREIGQSESPEALEFRRHHLAPPRRN